MLKVRFCAGLALSAAFCLALGATSASAATYCNAPTSPECQIVATPQGALDAAAAHPGFDRVFFGPQVYELTTGLSYSDGGDAANGVEVNGSRRCEGRQCYDTELRGGPPGGIFLDMTGAGTAPVTVQVLFLLPAAGVTGISLPANSTARGVRSFGGAVGVRLDGSPSKPASLLYSTIQAELAVDAPGRAVVEGSELWGSVGVRSRGGDVDVRGGEIQAFTAVSAPRARVVGTLAILDPFFATSPQPAVGFEALCEDATAADAEMIVTNATVAVGDNSDVVGARASARGGDGTACDARVDVSSTNFWGTRLAFDAQGDAGSGAAPQDGMARIDARYSDFSVARIARSGPTEVNTSLPGGNIDANPLYRDSFFFQSLWPSPLIDHGDPAAPGASETPWVKVIHGRRDIGHFEYGFQPPTVQVGAFPARIVRPHALVRLAAHAFDFDGDDLSVLWTLSNGVSVGGGEVEQRYSKPGIHTERVRVRDATGLTAAASLTIRVVRQRLTGLLVYPARFRTPNDPHRGRASIWVSARAYEVVRYRFERLKRPRHRRPRWVRLRGSRSLQVSAGRQSEAFNGWLGPNRRLRPGRYRVVMKAAGIKPVRARFRILR
jgi:hypothetical protein